MASLFGARRRRSPEDDGSGNGRAQRRRLSPEEDAVLPLEAVGTGSSPGWLSGFVSGAKRVFSSVLLFPSPEDPVSGDDDDSEDDNGLSSHEKEDVHDTVGPIVPCSASKLAIEKMIMQEKFSRDEFDKMVELLKTRVTDSKPPEAFEYGTPKERNMAWRFLSHDRNFPGSVPFSNIRSGTFSAGSPLQTSPELCTAAVNEAKKWLEEKRKGVGGLKPEDNGPSTLKTDMFSSGSHSEMGSPVDLAKSYMRSLPSWQSPFLAGQRFNTSSIGVHINDGEGPSSKGITEPLPAKDNGNTPQEYHPAPEIHPDKMAEGNNMSSASVAKDATGQKGDAKDPTAEPQKGESHIISASVLRPKDADPPRQISMNGSTKKTSANSLLNQSKDNSGIESSGNDNPSCTNSSSFVPPTSNNLTESAADAANVPIENGTGMNPEEPSKGSKQLNVRRVSKRVTRSSRGRGK